MKALVLSGGGNYGAMQAGALEVLLENGYRPRLIIGNSAGALNAIKLAAAPTLAGVAELQQSWRDVTKDHVGSVNLLLGLKQLVLQGESLFPSQPLLEYLRAHLPADIATFGELRAVHGIAAFALATNFDEGAPRVFGDRDEDRLLDGAMATTALPPYLPPWQVDGHRYVDGGIHSNLPLRAAIERGATELLTLWIRPPLKLTGRRRNVLHISSSAFNMMAQSLSAAELDVARRSGVEVRLLELHPDEDIEFWDFGQAERLIEAGRQAAQEILPLQGGGPSRLGPAGWLRSLGSALGGVLTGNDRPNSIAE